MSDAVFVRLGDVTTKVGSGATPRGGETAYKASGVPLIRSMNVHFDGFRLEGLAFLDEEQASALRNVEVKAGDVLLNITGASIGRVTIAPAAMHGARVNQHVCIVRPDARLDPSFLRWYLASPRMQQLINGIESGATRQALTKEKILGFVVPLPDRVEQERTVAEIEKQISRLDEAVANLRRVKVSLFRFQTSALSAATEGWDTVPLRALLREPLRNGHSAKATDDPSGLRAFTLSAVTEGDFSEVNTKQTVADAKKVADLWAQPGDIYVERSNTPELVGTARLYRGPANFAFIPDLLIRVRVSKDVSPEYMELALRSEGGRRYFQSRAQGIAGSMPKIDQGTVESFPVPLPPIAEQQNIVAEMERQLSIVAEFAAQVRVALARATRLQNAILASAFGN